MFQKFFLPLLIAGALSGCATTNMPPLQAIDQRVDLSRFMGDWYVHASIPIDLWFASEVGAHNGVETYRLRDDGKIATTYTFRKGSFDGERKQFTPVAWVYDKETNAEWRMQFLWPFRSPYLIIYLDDDYQKAMIGVPDREHAWIMSRAPDLSESDYAELVNILEQKGYDTNRLQRVPQQWPERSATNR